MALGATTYHFKIALSDVDRGVYESLDLRLARHPSETSRYLLTRTLAYCLSYEEGIAFSKGGLSDTEEAPASVRDPTGSLLAWIDVGAPSAERLHRASKAARRVAVFTHLEPEQLRQRVDGRAIHRAETIEVWCFEPAFLDAFEVKLERNLSFELVHTAGHLYVTLGSTSLEGSVARTMLVEGAAAKNCQCDINLCDTWVCEDYEFDLATHCPA